MSTATAKQFDFIKSLVSERDKTVGVTDVPTFLSTLKVERITIDGAKQLIDHLLKTPKNAVVGRPANVPVNKYAGNCVLCGARVEAGEGTYRRGTKGGWDTLHLSCPEAKAAVMESVDETIVLTSDQIVEGNLKDRQAWNVVNALVQEAEKGGYAIPAFTGTNDLTFFEIKVNQGRVNPEKKGQKFFKFVAGGDREFNATPSFIIRSLRAAEAAGVIESQKIYAAEFKCCARCGKPLSVEESRNVGYGPDCRIIMGV